MARFLHGINLSQEIGAFFRLAGREPGGQICTGASERHRGATPRVMGLVQVVPETPFGDVKSN